MLVSVLVPVLDERRNISESLAAMSAQRLDGDFELIFIDGGSTDGTRELLDAAARTDPRVRVLENPQRRIPSALNIGLRAAAGDYIARMDAHSFYPPDYLQLGIDRLRAGGVDWVTGPAIPRGTGIWSRRIALALGSPLGQGGSSKWQSAPPHGAGGDGAEVELDTGVFAGVWPRAVLERHGSWDEDWPVNEDAELAGRVLAAGGRIVCLRQMGAQYAPRETLAGLWRQYWSFGYYRVKTARRHPLALRRSHMLPIGLALTLGVALLAPRPLARQGRRALGAYALALCGVSARSAKGVAPRDVAALPVTFATMHLAWGLGFVAGCLRMGPPLRGLAGALLGRARTGR